MISAQFTRTTHRKLDATKNRIALKIPQALFAAAEILAAESLKLVPRDTQVLANNCVIRQLGTPGFGSIVTVGYGTPGLSVFAFSPRGDGMQWRTPAEYAVLVHEVGSYGSLGIQTGQPNYLLEPILTKQPEMRMAFNAVMVAP